MTFFAAGSVEAKWIPKIILYNKEMEFNANPNCLGVTMDRTLSFQQHVDAVVKTVEARCKAIAVLGASTFDLWLEDGAAQKGLLSHAEECSGLRRPWLATLAFLSTDGPS